MLENVRKCSRNYTPISIAFCTTSYREGLARARLAVREDSAVVAFEARVYHFFGHCRVDPLLLGYHVKNAIKLEVVVVVFDFSVAQTISLEVQLNLIALRVERCKLTLNKLSLHLLSPW
jgi:hypothetical protein